VPALEPQSVLPVVQWFAALGLILYRMVGERFGDDDGMGSEGHQGQAAESIELYAASGVELTR
jgi:hypothetical protein